MNGKITFPELVEMVAQVTNTSKRMSELFLKELFATISQTLIAGESVRIKNLGQFKVESVKPRKSVSVNTGQEVEIPTHNRLVFTPAKSLADALNEPFSHFDTVVLSDDITDEQLAAINGDVMPEVLTDEPLEDTIVEPTEEPVVEPIEEPVVEPTEEPVEEPIEEPVVEPIDEPVGEAPAMLTPPPFIPVATEAPQVAPTEPKVPEQPADTEAPAVTPPAFSEPVVPDTEVEVGTSQVPASEDGQETPVEVPEPVAETTTETTPVAAVQTEEPASVPPALPVADPIATPVAEETAAPVVTEATPDDSTPGFAEPIENEEHPIVEFERAKRDIARKSLVKGVAYGAVAMLVIVLLLWGVYSLGAYSGKQDAKGNQDDQPATEQTSAQDEAYVEIEPTNETSEEIDDEFAQGTEVQAPEQPVENKVVTDTCTETMYLTRIARKHYGNRDFWVYIYEENKDIIPNPNRIKPGTVVVIPPREKYGIDPDNPESVLKAKKESTRLFAHFMYENGQLPKPKGHNK